MNKIFYNGLLACALGATAMLTACSENSWNDVLGGFKTPTIGTSDAIAYTLTDADYSAIASNATNKAIAEIDGEADALKAIGTAKSFADNIQARKYLPAFLSSTSFPYYTLNDGSSVKVSFNTAADVNPTVQAINAGTLEYDVTEADYKAAWESDDNFVNAFAPVTPATSYLPGYLKTAFPDAEAGAYAAVSYNWSAQNPVFGTAGGGEQGFKLSNVLGGVSLDQQVSVQGVVTAMCTRGFILTDKGGSILVYGADFDENSVSMYDYVNVSGTVSSYGTAFQIALASATVEVAGSGEYTYPAPVSLTPDLIKSVCDRTADETAFYAEADATLGISGNYYNLYVDGLEGYDLSAYYTLDYYKDIMEDGEKMHIKGYVIGKSGSSHCNIVITEVSSPTRARRAPAADPVTEKRVALYRFNGAAWQAASDVWMLQPSDYTALGQSYANLSGTGPQDLLPRYLKMQFPFAAEEDAKTVCYYYYDSSAKASTYRAMQFDLAGGEWVRNAGEVTEQFSRTNGVWQYNPSIVLNLPSDKSAFCVEFYQACVDYVFETQCVPLGDDNIKSGKYWVTSYGNNEYWSGTSAYQTNVDIRPAAARAQYPAGFEGMTDEEVQEFIITNFHDHTLPYVLAKYYPDFGPIDGIDVTLTVNYGTYDGGRAEQQVVYRVLAPGKYERISSTLFPPEGAAE